MKSKKYAKRLLSFIIASVMIVTMLPVSALAAGVDDVMIEDQAETIVEEAVDVSGEVVEEAAEVPDIENSEDAATVEGAVDEIEEADPEELTGYTETLSFTAQGVPSGSKMHFDAQLTGLRVSAVVPAKRAAKGSVMTADIVDVSAYEDAIAKKNYGKSIAGLYGLELHFYDKKGKEITHINTSNVTISADAMDADSYALCRLNGSSVGVVKKAFAPEFTFKEKKAYTYAIVGLGNNEDGFDFETEDYKIKVFYTAEAKIPIGTELVVSQIEDDSDKYQELWNKSLAKLNENATCGSETEPDTDTRKGIAAAAFFDISLINNGQELEPEVPLQVEIKLKNGGLPRFDGEDVKVIHFAADGTEIIDGSQLNTKAFEEQLPEDMPGGEFVNDFVYMQDSFSEIGVFTTDDYVDENAVTDTGFKAPVLRAAGDSIAADKTVTDNDNDGIYDLELYVVGNSEQSQDEEIEKSNVILVVDRSGSMEEQTSTVYTYSASTYDSNATYYAYNSNGNWRRYYHDADGWYRYNYQNQKRYDSTGDIYLVESRLAATKRAANALIDALLENNDSTQPGHGDIVEISLISFSGPNWGNTDGVLDDATIVVPYNNANTTDATYLKNQVNGINYGGATNWEAALRKAKSEADNFRRTEPNENVSIIFLTDGKPTVYIGGGNGASEGDSNVQLCWNNAKDEARSIASNDAYTLYNIFAYGNGSNYLKSLTNYAYGRNGNWTDTEDTTYTDHYFFDAQDTTALEAAFDVIIHQISNNVGYGGVGITDGVNLGATNTSATVGGTVHQKEFAYTVYDGTRIVYSVRFDDAGNNATFTINGQPYTATCETVNTPITNAEGTVVKTITSKVATVTVEGVEYKMSPATMNSAGLIEWELAGLGVLPNYKFALSMHVWPNQMAYDIAADMNNQIYPDLETAIAAYGITDADEIAKIKASIKKETDGSYSVYTNYQQSVRYYEADEETVDGVTTTTYGDEKNKPLTQPNPIPLKGSTIPMEKRWGSDLAIVELQELVFGKNGVYNGYKVALDLKKDGVLYKTYEFPKLNGDGQPVDAEGNVSTDVRKLVWHQDAAISSGRLVKKDPGGKEYKTVTLTGKDKNGTDISGTYFVVEDGHEYEISEKEGSDLHFEFSTDIYHPMLVDGTLMNVKVVRDSSGKIVNGSTVEIIDPEMTSVYATNTLKGGLNIRKIVTAEDKVTPKTGVKDEFTFEITVTKDGQPYGTPSDQYSTTKPAGYDDDPEHGGWSYDSNNAFYYKSGFSAYNIYSGKDESGERERLNRSWIPADGKLTLTMPADGEIRVVNLPNGTQYTVKEIIGDSGEYHYLKTVSSIIYGEDENGDDLIEDEPAPVTTEGNTVSGTIVGDKANLEEYYNWADNFYVYHSKDNTVEKISFADPRVKGTYENGKYKYEFNIVEETKENCLYGGYYKAYGGQKLSTDAIKALTFNSDGKSGGVYTKDKAKFSSKSWAEDKDANNNKGKPYDATSATAWKSANKGDAGNGLEMKPKKDTVYYLKEVPEAYISPYIYYVYGEISPTNELLKLYMITDTDDKNYSEVGIKCYETTTDKSTTTLVASIRVTKTGQTDVYETLTAKNLSSSDKVPTFGQVPRGFLAYWEVNNLIVEDASYDMVPYWKTLDGVIVTGKSRRTVSIGDGTYKVNGGTGGLSVNDNTSAGSTAGK